MGQTNKRQTIALENYARNSINYYCAMTDKNGLPYFNIFWTNPAEAAHDWPDFGDVTSRQLQAAVMLRHMTGRFLPIEKIWLIKIMSYLNTDSGFIIRPLTHFSQGDDGDLFLGDQALTLYALLTVYLDQPDKKLKATILKMVDGLDRIIPKMETAKQMAMAGFCVKSLMICARYLQSEIAFCLSAWIVKKIFDENILFSSDNKFYSGGHTHMNLRTLVGAADYALAAGDEIIYRRVDAFYRYVKSIATRFGFIPEVVDRPGDIIACETCALMDYIGLAITLANHGHPEYWGDVERIVRNHLIESQVTDTSWLKTDATKTDTEQFSWRDIDKRMIGGYADWSSPNHILAGCETLPWGGPELRSKIRAFQNCCGGSGTHAFFAAWKNIARFDGKILWINMHLDKLLPEAEIRCHQPYEGLLTIDLKASCDVKIRVPDFVKPSEMKIETAGKIIEPKVYGNFLVLEQRSAGERFRISYPVPIETEEISIGNPGFRQYRYRVSWKGDTVIKMESLGNEYEAGYSDFEKKDIPCFYGAKGPGLLYQRSEMLEHQDLNFSELHLDQGILDFWKIK